MESGFLSPLQMFRIDADTRNRGGGQQISLRPCW